MLLEGIARGGMGIIFRARQKEPERIVALTAIAAALSSDGRLFAVTSLLGYFRIWEWASLRERGTLHGFLRGAHSLTFSRDGKRVAAGSNGREALKTMGSYDAA